MRRSAVGLVLLAGLVAGCGAGAPPGRFVLPDDEVEQYDTAYLAEVVADPEAADEDSEFVVIRNNWDHRTDMGGWYVETDDGTRLPLGIGRQIDPDAELRVHTACGDDTDDAVYACLDEPDVFPDDAGTLTLRDSAGAEVATLNYGETG